VIIARVCPLVSGTVILFGLLLLAPSQVR
jgi:hypothetical protein